MDKELDRGAGILLPVSSLPSPYGIGTLGKAAYEFIDKLKKAGQKYWQVLPVGPTSYGDSPYQSFSAFAGNPYFIDLDILIEDGLLSHDDVDNVYWGSTDEYVEYDNMFVKRFPILKKSYQAFLNTTNTDFEKFVLDNAYWLDDYSLFMACKEAHGNREWLSWEDELKFRHEDALNRYSNDLKEQIGFYKYLQFMFYKQWKAVKTYANSKGISIIGDIPLYVALDSADVWSDPDQFKLDENLQPINVAGCPPDAFSDYGQKWGNPIYDWDKMEKDDFTWWRKRMSAQAALYDVIRIDHFIGIVRYYNIPLNDVPKKGFFLKGPGIKLIKAIDESIGDAKVIAEDLGVVVPEVVELVKESGYPGMKVFEFAFDGNTTNEHSMHNHMKNCVVYIGTHDNETMKGYISNATDKNKEYMMKYLNVDCEDNIIDELIRTLYMSVADTVILQMQDVLKKDNSARMNLPSTIGTNWKWRLRQEDFTDEMVSKLYELSRIYGRNYIKNYFDWSEYMLENICKEKYNKTIKECTNEELYVALLHMTKNMEKEKESSNGKKKLYYISAEFLIGKLMSNNLINLGIYDRVRDLLAENGKSLAELEELENEPSLGNGGLGRLAACFLDSIATLGLNGDGIGINYHLGLFKQVFKNNLQKETVNPWIDDKSWLNKTDVSYEIEFGNCKVKSVLYDIDVTGYHNRTNKLHLFDIETVDETIVKDGGIDFDKNDICKNLTLFLYPDDSDEAGNLLRIYQQYFMVSNAARLILDECKKKGSNLHDLADYAAIQINDTHPSMVIPELIRLLTAEGIAFDEAAEIVTNVCAYTNHTILAEALEKWPIAYLEKVVPVLVPIIEKLDEKIKAKFSDPSVYIIDETNRVHMAHMDIHYGHSVNGVAGLHTEILKDVELNNFYKIYPEKFNNKTNGITFRRWLLHCNKELSAYIESLIGNGFKKDALELEKLLEYGNDEVVLNKLLDIKKNNKEALCSYLAQTEGVEIDPESVFDIQIKRLHEYKRQQMNALYIIYKYFEIKKGNLPKRPITAIFGAKAAPAYVIAKDIIHLILCLQQVINNDPEVSPYLKVVMVENYNVTKAEKLIPAADISEQISLASKEASGTGNMKFMLNGAVTLGTMDGANVEIHDLVGKDNIYIFGESSEQVIEHYKNSDYRAADYYINDSEIKKFIDFIISSEIMKAGNPETLLRLHAELIKKDWFMTLLDLKDYISVKEQALSDYEDRMSWAKKALVNIGKAGYFSSDRTIEEYNKDIWNL